MGIRIHGRGWAGWVHRYSSIGRSWREVYGLYRLGRIAGCGLVPRAWIIPRYLVAWTALEVYIEVEDV